MRISTSVGPPAAGVRLVTILFSEPSSADVASADEQKASTAAAVMEVKRIVMKVKGVKKSVGKLKTGKLG